MVQIAPSAHWGGLKPALNQTLGREILNAATALSNRAAEALRRIAGKSEINKRRVKKFGVSLEDA